MKHFSFQCTTTSVYHYHYLIIALLMTLARRSNMDLSPLIPMERPNSNQYLDRVLNWFTDSEEKPRTATSSSPEKLGLELKDMSPASSRGTRSTVPDESILALQEDSSSFSDDIPSCSGASGFSNNSDERDFAVSTPVRKARLTPDFRGIGITIAGGVYSPYGPELLPVFITGVDPDGPAAQSGEIKVSESN